ncbi:hypothetical protein BSM4216_2562 [Bacillus smithii]|nr:hypothetical protein BSM4216_2562 [Bacillus smithii]
MSNLFSYSSLLGLICDTLVAIIPIEGMISSYKEKQIDQRHFVSL